MKLATVKFYLDTRGSRFDITGPRELLVELSVRLRGVPTDTPEQRLAHNQIYSSVLAGWYVECSQTKEQISLADLNYWDFETQSPFKDIQVAIEWMKKNGKFAGIAQ